MKHIRLFEEYDNELGYVEEINKVTRKLSVENAGKKRRFEKNKQTLVRVSERFGLEVSNIESKDKDLIFDVRGLPEDIDNFIEIIGHILSRGMDMRVSVSEIK